MNNHESSKKRFIAIVLVVLLMFYTLIASGFSVSYAYAQADNDEEQQAKVMIKADSIQRSPEDEWTNEAVTVTGMAVTEGSSKLVWICYGSEEEYNADKFASAREKMADFEESSGAFSFSIDEEYKGDLYIWAYDNAGNKSDAITVEINIDKTPPQIIEYKFEKQNSYSNVVCKASSLLAPLYFNETIAVTLTVVDGTISSGLNSIEVKYNYLSPNVEIIDNGGSEYQAKFFLPTDTPLAESVIYDGKLTAVIKDNAGNELVIDGDSNIDLMIENIKPEISVEIEPDEIDYININGDKHWYKSDVTFKISAEDEHSGLASVKRTLYKNDSIIYQNKETKESFEVVTPAREHGDGKYTLEIAAEDNAGNTNKIIKTVYIDKTAPEGKITVGELGSCADATKYSHNEQTVSIDTKDEGGSGVKETKYYIHQTDAKNLEKLNQQSLEALEDWEVYNEPFQIEPGDVANRFIIYVKITDNAGNTAYINTETIVLDNKIPEISVAYSVNQNNTIKAEIVIDERNFSADGTAIEIEAVNANGTVLEGISPVNRDWLANGDKHTLTLYFVNDANYSLKIDSTDLAGNVATYRVARFTVDRTYPTGKITIDDSRTQSWSWTNLPGIKFEIFSKTALNISIESDDETSGVASVHYFKSYSALTKEELNNLQESDWVKGTSLIVNPDEQFVIYARIIDRAENKTYISSNGVIVDSTSSQPKISVAMLEPAQGIYGSDVQVRIDVEEPIVNNTYAGIEEIYYRVITKGVPTKEVCLLNNGVDIRARIFSRTVTIDAAVNNSNDVVIEVYAKDHAGNEANVEKNLKIDITAPAIEVIYDNHNTINNDYYKETRTATVVIHERNFNENDVVFSITNSDGIQPIISGWTHSQDLGISDNTTHTATVSFAAEGDYTFTLSYTDLAGNKAVYNTVDRFTIDKTIPEVSVIYDNNNSKNAYYYNETRTATICINEHNFNPSDVNVKITAVDNGSTILTPEIGSFNSNGDIRTAAVTFSADGEYTLEVEYTDMAGNDGEAYGDDHFVIDTKTPEIQILGIEDMSANNGVVAPVIVYSDTNYDAGSLTITLSGYNNGSMEILSTTSSIQNGEKIQLDDFAYNKDYDDLYTLKAVTTDKAGNQEEAAVIFSVNRFGSVYVLGDATRALVNNYYTNKEVPLIVTEINVDVLEFIDITYTRDGNIETLEDGIDYSVSASGSDASWKSYVYTVYEDNFKEEGTYSVTFYSMDRAANISDNKVKEMVVEFVVDKTPPTIVLSGIENAKQYNTDRVTMAIDAKDNVCLQNVVVYLDNICVKTFTDEELSESNGITEFEILSADNWQEIRVTGMDAAGNEVAVDGISVLITTNLWIQLYQNKPLFVAFTAVAGIVLGGVGFLAFFMKRKFHFGKLDA